MADKKAMFLTDSVKYDVIGISIALLTITIAYCKWSLSYWKRKGLVTPTPYIPFGNTSDLFLGRKTFGEIWKDIYFEFKSKGLRHGGAYFSLKPIYVPVDLEIVKNILQNDFQHFVGHGVYVNEESDPLSVNVFNLDGAKWKNARTKLTPTFTTGKMKMMFQTLVECSYGLLELLNESSKGNTPVDIKDIMGRFTTDIIGSCAFGIDCNSMKNPESEFRKYGLRSIDVDFKETIKQMLPFMIPHSILRFFNYRTTNSEVTKFFMGIVEETVTYREKNNITRKDFMHLLIQLKNNGTLGDEKVNGKSDNGGTNGTITLNEISAQSFIFFIAGFETSSTTLNFAAYELAVNPEIQDKLRQEINTILEKHNDKLTYDAVMEMAYLDKVIHETLRKYPPLPELFRVCNKDYKVPDTDVVIETGTSVMIPILGIHQDPEYYPNPSKFDPERFNEQNKANRPQFSWLPFGEGPRVCIGLRFGMMQTKIGLLTLIKNYKVTLNEKTKTPLVFKKTGVICSAEGGIWIDIHKLHN